MKCSRGEKAKIKQGRTCRRSGRSGSEARSAQSEGFRTLNEEKITPWAWISTFGEFRAWFFSVGELVVHTVVGIVLSWSWSVVDAEVRALTLADS